MWDVGKNHDRMYVLGSDIIERVICVHFNTSNQTRVLGYSEGFVIRKCCGATNQRYGRWVIKDAWELGAAYQVPLASGFEVIARGICISAVRSSCTQQYDAELGEGSLEPHEMMKVDWGRF